MTRIARPKALASALLAGLLTGGCSAATVPSGATVTSGAPSAPAPTVSATRTGSASPGASATSPRSTTPAPSAAALTVGTVSNFRDVAGDGLRLPNGARMATGVVYRSAKLATASRADVARLSRSGIGLVIDLRTNAIVARSPDPAIPGVAHRLVNIYAVYATPAVRPRSVSAAEAYMRGLNVHFVSVAAQRAKVAEALQLIADADAPVLVHCTEGKDRTGWISAVLQLVAGADRDQVMAEYLKSNDYRADIVESAYRSVLASSGRTAARIRLALLQVRAGYLNAGLAEMDRRYGGLDGYLTKGLGLSNATVTALRERLTA